MHRCTPLHRATAATAAAAVTATRTTSSLLLPCASLVLPPERTNHQRRERTLRRTLCNLIPPLTATNNTCESFYTIH
uniref:Putative secreted protein n=1 Tax=Anopheles triannulatus TaxID=58253 RepID=A0A2M4B671_9DIPT